MGTVGVALADGRMLRLSESLCEVLREAVDDGSGELWVSVEVPGPVYTALKRRGLAVWQRLRGVQLTPLGVEACRKLGGPLELTATPYPATTMPGDRFGGRRRAVLHGRRPEHDGALEAAEFAQAPPMVGASDAPSPVVDAELSPGQARQLRLALEQRALLLRRSEEATGGPFARWRRERERSRRLEGPRRVIEQHPGRYVDPWDLDESSRWTLSRVQSATGRVLRSPLVLENLVDRELNRRLVAVTEWAVARELESRNGDDPEPPWWDVALVDPLEVRIQALEAYAQRLFDVERAWSERRNRARLREREASELEFLVRRALWVGQQIDDRESEGTVR